MTSNRSIASSVSSLRSRGISVQGSEATSFSTGSSSTDSSALSALANLMNQQADVVQALAGGSSRLNSSSSQNLNRLDREKQALAAQVTALQRQLKAIGGDHTLPDADSRSGIHSTSDSSTSSVWSRGHSFPRSRDSVCSLDSIPEVVTGNEGDPLPKKSILNSRRSVTVDECSVANSSLATDMCSRRTEEASTIDHTSFTHSSSYNPSTVGKSFAGVSTGETSTITSLRQHSNNDSLATRSYEDPRVLHEYKQSSATLKSASGRSFASRGSFDDPSALFGSTLDRSARTSSLRRTRSWGSSRNDLSLATTIDHTSFSRSTNLNPSTIGKSFGSSYGEPSTISSYFPPSTLCSSLSSKRNPSSRSRSWHSGTVENGAIDTSQFLSQLHAKNSLQSQPLGLMEDLTSVPDTATLSLPTIAMSSLEDKDKKPPKSPTRSLSGHASQTTRGSRSSGDTRIRGSRKERRFEAPLADFCRPESPPGSQTWRSFSFLCTFLVPDVCIPRKGNGAKQAWREKVTICLLVLFLSILVVGGVGFLPVLLCRDSDLLTQQEIWSLSDGAALTTIFGRIYDMSGFMNSHPGGIQGIAKFLGNDATKLFPRLPPASLPKYCLSQDSAKVSYLVQNSVPSCPLLTTVDKLQGLQCHDTLLGPRDIQSQLATYHTGDLVVPSWRLGENGMQWVQIDKTIYNVTQYIDGLKEDVTQVTDDPAHPNAFLYEPLHRLIVNLVNKDATGVYNDLFETDQYKFCLDELFYEARIDDRYDPFCEKIGVLMYFFLFLVTGLLAVQVMCSMVYLFRRHHAVDVTSTEAGVIVLVPCYNEGDAELRKTINSCVETSYPEDNKVLLVVADGVVTGSGEAYSTPETLARILDIDMDLNEDRLFHYRSIGKRRDNYASVYKGIYEREVKQETKSIKFIVVVKRGAPDERTLSRPGNRGKRDSQLIIQGMLNRIHHNREPCALDIALVKSLYEQGLPTKDIEYLMCIDADTRVDSNSIAHMVYSMEEDKSILACCGETQVDNKTQSWVTMIQIFEYYSSHHLKKAFESVFGCVTCLPGCFTMYRIFTEDMQSLIGDDRVFQEYARTDIPSLHEKNLFELGEDRMLATLLLQHFPGMKLSFVPEAVCWTVVPHTMTILLSQRRRWINSTFHNMYELLKVNTMCGVAVFSMKMVVVMDLIVTMILPASLAYVIYLSYLFATQPETIDRFVLIFYACTFCLQMLSFVMRSRWDYFAWFAIFCVAGIPVFYFILPLYSFINMDDFSWGKTRKVGSDGEQQQESSSAENSDATALDFSGSSDMSSHRQNSSRALSIGDSSGGHTGSTTLVLTNFAPSLPTEDAYSRC